MKFSLLLVQALGFTCFTVTSATATTEIFNVNGTQIRVIDSGGERSRIEVNDAEFTLSWSEVLIHTPESLGTADTFPNWTLVQTWGGGNGCGGIYYWLNTSEMLPSLSDPLGRCREAPGELSVNDGWVELKTIGYGSEGNVIFAYDGSKVVERNAGLSELKGILNPYDPMAWKDATGADYMNAPENEAFLIDLLGWDALHMLRFYNLGSGGFVEDGNWLVHSVCKPHLCDQAQLIIAISKIDATPFIAYTMYGEDGWKTAGTLPSDMPNSLRGLLTGTR